MTGACLSVSLSTVAVTSCLSLELLPPLLLVGFDDCVGLSHRPDHRLVVVHGGDLFNSNSGVLSRGFALHRASRCLL